MGSTDTLTATAIVASENLFHKSGPLWSLEDVEISRALHEDELLVKMVATGVCHTDVTATSLPAGNAGVLYPKIAGHEGMYCPHVSQLAHVRKRGSLEPPLNPFGQVSC